MKPEAEEHLLRAEKLLNAARDLMELDYPAESIGRSYYAMFHAATAVLLEMALQRSPHHGLWSAFGQFVTARGLMEVRHHHAGLRLFAARSRSEYLASPKDTRDDAERDLATARDFIAACPRFLEKRATTE
jgi:uncharacterized protein (UPF0332 family)